MHKEIKITIQQHTDCEVVLGLQARKRSVEEWFYHSAKDYFWQKFNEVFFDQDMKMTIFQESFIRLWTQIENGEIHVADGKLHRRQKNGSVKVMTCSLNTFLFAIAKNEYRELVRSNKEVFVDSYFDNVNNSNMAYTPDAEDVKETQVRIVDECIQMMPPRCLEILTLFYIKGKSLDEIMEIRKDKNTSKVGLKSAKYKCMNTLRERITEQFNRLNIKM